ncbi:WD repeat-containing protein 89-like isoform X2 [Dysidea avara]|uniref:WD repeat-containing protein 89-like isoform X2 n=1 Tax=Dysidea avara TaxID=196820 RepID=UPI003317C4AC
MAAKADAKPVFAQHVLRCRSSFDISGEPTYLFELASSVRDNTSIIAATASNNVIKTYSRDTLQPQGLLKGHDGVITGLCFSHTNPNLLLSCSNDKTVRLWDLRGSSQDVTIFKAKPRVALTSFDLNCTDTLIAAGAELVEEDAYLFFWDIRSPKVMGKFSESHNDDITQVKFCPSYPTQLASGSTDGLVCVYDITELDEDEAIVSVLNTESSVANLGYFGPQYEYVYSLTHTETFHVWNALQANLLSNQRSVRELLLEKHKLQVDYLVDCTYNEATQRLFIVAGDHNGRVYVTHNVTSHVTITVVRYM